MYFTPFTPYGGPYFSSKIKIGSHTFECDISIMCGYKRNTSLELVLSVTDVSDTVHFVTLLLLVILILNRKLIIQYYNCR